MKMKLSIIYILFMTIFTIIPSNTYAFGVSTNTNTNSYVQILDGETIDCNGDNSLLGNVNDEKSVAWLLQKLLNYIKILGPSIAIVLGSLDFIKAIVSSDEENMKKTQKRFGNRLIAAALLFFIHLIVELLLGLFGFTTNVTCGLK